MHITTTPLYQAIASLRATIERCKATNPQHPFLPTHEKRLEKLLQLLPSGSGLDRGVQLIDDECKSNRLVFQADYHHMNENGFYDGWTEHRIVVTPSLEYGAVIRITGRDRRDVKQSLHELFHQAMFQQVNPYPRLDSDPPGIRAA